MPRLPEADNLVKKADKLTRKSGILYEKLGLINQRKAYELYLEAASLYEAAEMWHYACDAYTAAVGLVDPYMNYGPEACGIWKKAADCMREGSPEYASNIYSRITEYSIKNGNQLKAAQYSFECAEIFENGLKDRIQCIEYYQKAADLYKGLELVENANECLLKVAENCGFVEIYDKSFKIYEQMGKETFDENEQSNQYFLKASLVSLCIKEENTFDLINSYSETSSNFGESRQYSFLKTIMRSIREANVDNYYQEVKEYRSDCPADELTNTLLKRIKEIVEEARYGFVI